jgi:hypothetical protein
MVRTQASAVKGSIPADDMNLVNTNLLLRAFMQFRNWVPGTAAPRFKGFHYNTVMDRHDVGRFKVQFGEFAAKGFLPKLAAFKNMLGEVIWLHNKPNSEQSDYYYQKYLDEQLITEEELSKEQFIALRTAKLRGMAAEIRMYILIMSLALLAKGMIPDDKDDETRQAAVVLYRMLNRSSLEVGFWLLPGQTSQMLKSTLPQLSVFTDIEKLVVKSLESGYYTVTGKEMKKDKKRRPARYYLWKLTPGVASFVDIVDAFDTYNPNSGWKY